jgi:type II pantothenate kinase
MIEKMLKIDSDQVVIDSNVIGLDLGQTLSKLAYYDKGQIILSLGETITNLKEISEFLNTNENRFKKANLTGGRAFNLYQKYQQIFDSTLISEFEANARGLNFLFQHNKKKPLPPSLIVTLGTGTSMVLNKDNIEHIGGSALGGGFFKGIANLLYNSLDYSEAITLASKGNRYNVDLKVGDIYEKGDTRIDLLFREYTAASLEKANTTSNKEDVLSAIISTIGENIGTIATLTAENHEIDTIFFCGGFLIQNKPLKQILSLLCKVRNKKAIFIKNSEFAGAIGALVHKN